MAAEQLIAAIGSAALPSWSFQRNAGALVIGLPPEGLCLVRAGHVVRMGGGAGLDLVSAGEAFMVPSSAEPEQDLDEPVGYAATAATLWAIGAKSLAYVHSKPDLAVVVLSLQRAAQTRLDRLTMARARVTAPERIADLLHVLSDERGRCPPLRQRDIAALLAMRLETVCRGLRVLQDRDIVTEPWMSSRHSSSACRIDRAKLMAYLLTSAQRKNGD